MQGESGQASDRIVGKRRSYEPRHARLSVILGVALVVLFLLDLYHRRWGMLSVLLVAMAVNTVVWLRPPARVDRAGIAIPWSRHRWIPWESVESVRRADPWTPGYARVVLRTGRTVSLWLVDGRQTAHVAELGGKPLTGPPTTAVPHPPPLHIDRPRTDVETAADVDRRARALEQGWADLDRQSQRIHPYRRPAPKPGDVES